MMGEQERYNLAIIVALAYIVIPMIDSTAAVDTYKNTMSQLDGQDDIFGSHQDVCCDVSDVGFIF